MDTSSGPDASPAGTPRVHLHLLGQPRLTTNDGTDRLLERRDAALLALLALEGPQPRAQVARWLWPDSDDVKALRNLRQRLFRLRRATGQPLVLGQATLSLDSSVVHDVHLQSTIDDEKEPIGLLSSCDYADCEPLAERVEALRQHWRSACITALEAGARHLNDLGRVDEALTLVRRALLLQPGSARAWHRLIHAEHAAGDSAQALASFERCCEALARLGSEPARDTVDLVDRIRAGREADAQRLRAPHVALARPPRLVGRAAEWEQMREAWQQGRVIVLRGVPGIGKSRLCADFMHAAGGGLGLKLPLDGAQRPFALLARLWQAVVTRLPAAAAWAVEELSRLSATDEREPPTAGAANLPPAFRLGSAWRTAVETWLAQGLGPLWIDDLQWADAASLDLLLPWLEPGPLRPPVLLSLRQDESVSALDTWLDRRTAGEVLEVMLGPLDEPAVREFVASLDLPDAGPAQVRGTARALLRQVGGHPFRMLEWLRAEQVVTTELADGPPGPPPKQRHPASALSTSLVRRVQQLPAGPLRLLRVAALAGGAFSVPLAAELLGVHPLDLADDWRALTQAQLMQDDGTVFDLVIEATRECVPMPIARHLHERLAAIGHARQLRPDWVADQWAAAAQWPQAAAALEQSARQAASLARPAEALAFWDRAAECHARAGDALARWRAEREAVDVAGASAGAQDWLARTLRLLEGAPPTGPDRFDALFRRGKALYNVDPDVRACLPPLELALAEAEAAADDSRQLRVCGLLLPALVHAGRSDEAMRLLAALEPAAAGHVRDDAPQLFHSGRGLALFALGQYADSAVATESALSVALERGDLFSALVEAGNLIAAHRSTGQLERAAAHADQVIALWDRLDRPRSTFTFAALASVANLDVDQGRFARALELGTLARDHFRETGSADWCTVVESRLFQAWLRLGQPARARQVLSPLPADAGIDRRVGRLMQECRLDSMLNRPVLERLHAAVGQHLAELLPRNRLTLQLQLAAALPPVPALELARQVLHQTLASGDGVMVAPAWMQCADALRRLGRGDEAAGDAVQAWSAAEQQAPFGLYWVDFCWTVHQAAEAGGSVDLAGVALRSGLEWIEQALPHVPPECVDSFRVRNPANRALLARATRLDTATPGPGA